ncbi:hypothetical protein MMC24_005377 [Lignoscripta atroalba]|nr:hypothetical protein [Lignoscripta atroalba]
MSSATSSSKMTPPTSGARGSKVQKPSKIAALKLSSSILSRFPHERVTRKPSRIKSPASSASTSTPIPPSDTRSSADVKPESSAIPAAAGSENLEIPNDESKRKGGPGSKLKRPFGSLSDGFNKPRAKPGPKKRQKLDNGMLDSNEAAPRPWTTPAPISGHKVGPKANQGAINAGLRALDRTGKPCRKWEKKGFRVKSFTGVTWQLPSWRTPKVNTVSLNGEAEPESTPTSNSETKINNGSSNVESDRSQNGNAIPSNAPSSPVPAAATPA